MTENSLLYVWDDLGLCKFDEVLGRFNDICLYSFVVCYLLATSAYVFYATRRIAYGSFCIFLKIIQMWVDEEFTWSQIISSWNAVMEIIQATVGRSCST